MTLVEEHPVDTLRVHAARTLVGSFTVTARDLREVGREDLNLSYWPVHLEEKYNSLELIHF